MESSNYDVIIIGAGAVGCSAARALAAYDVDVLVLEAGSDIASGATRANSGIVHTGYDPTPGSCKAAYNVRGAKMFLQLQRELGFSYRKNGALVVAFTEEEKATLRQLADRALQNGAPAVAVIDQQQLRNLEPNIAPEALAALHVPDSGIVDPYGFTFALAENAAENGVTFAFNRRVVDVAPLCQPAANAQAAAVGQPPAASAQLANAQPGVAANAQAAAGAGYQVVLEDGKVVFAPCIINAAGAYSAAINNMISATKLTIAPRKGEYHLYKEGVKDFDHTLFPVPSAAGKGVLVGTSSFGNQFVGPNATNQDSLTDVDTTQEGLAEVMASAQRLWPNAEAGTVIANFAGIRATNADTGDFVVGPVADAPGFFNAACIDSPGLASSPAIGADLAQWVAQYLQAAPRKDFNPVRVPAPLLFMMSEDDRARLVEQDPRFGTRICGCADVTEGEVVAALHRALPVGSFDALKWRTGVTMGECQGGRCIPRILDVMAAELGLEACDIMKRNLGSPMVSRAKCQCEVPLPPRPNKVYEKPRSMYRIAGSRPAGLYSAYGAQCVMARTGFLPGEDVLVWGRLEQADACAQWLERAGARVTRVREGNVVQIEGQGVVSSVIIESPGGLRTEYACDALVMSDEMLDHISLRHH